MVIYMNINENDSKEFKNLYNPLRSIDYDDFSIDDYALAEQYLQKSTDSGVYLHLSKSLKSNRNLALIALKNDKNGLVYQHFDDKLRADYELTKMAVEKCEMNYEYASSDLQKKDDIIDITFDGLKRWEPLFNNPKYENDDFIIERKKLYNYLLLKYVPTIKNVGDKVAFIHELSSNIKFVDESIAEHKKIIQQKSNEIAEEQKTIQKLEDYKQSLLQRFSFSNDDLDVKRK